MVNSNEEEDLSDLHVNGAVYVRRKTNAGPWRNKKEFDQVYQWIFGNNASHETKEKACKQMKIWKLRRINLTPGTILSTLLILEAELKDKSYQEDERRSEDVCAVYSSAFTRFLNYMSAISQQRNMKTMYAVARELNIDPFLIDLRHLCAHGHTMPTIDVFRRTCQYCLNWLRDFYWDVQREAMVDVDARTVRKKDVTEFDEHVREMFLFYDAASEVLAFNCDKICEAKKKLSDERFLHLKRFATAKGEESVKGLIAIVLKSLSSVAKKGNLLKDLPQIFVDAFLGMTYFFEIGEAFDKIESSSLVANHQYFFRMIAANGFIEELYQALIEAAENEYENIVRRKGAGFWAKQIVAAFVAFKQVKMLQKKQKENNADASLSLSSINVQFISKELVEAYESLGFSVKSTLIFGDSTKCPWTLSFNREYIVERLDHINEYTVDIIKSCLELVEPPLLEEESAKLRDLICIYAGGNIDGVGNQTDKVYSLQNDVLASEKAENVEMEDVDESEAQQEVCGIWSKVTDVQEWSTCPLGRLMWE